MNFSFVLDILKEVSIIFILAILAYFLVQFGNKYIDKNKELHISKKRLAGILLLIFFIVILYFIFMINGLRSILFTLIISISLAYIINPLVNFLEKKKVKRVFGILLIYIGILGIIYLISVLIIPAIFKEVKDLVELLPKYTDEISNFSNDFYNNYYKNLDNLPFGLNQIKDTIENNISNVQEILLDAASGTMNFIMNFFSKALNVVLIPIIVFYLVKDKDYFKKNVILTIPNKHRTSLISLSREIDYSLGNFIRGQLTIAAFVGTLTAIGLLILDVNYAFTIGLIAGVTNVIPYFGAVIGGGIGMFFAFLDTPIKALWVLILFIVVNQIEGNFLQPKIMGDKVGLHPIIIIIALLVAGNLFGIIGMLIAVPIATTVKIVFSHIIRKISSM
ncbi:MAG: AI-2E family transporter [Senegalia sp. (in: firmicutes)]|uniref:AI-2E family transporter n=1 Tax=Senegalia sp. (in: firmicutes) TaxID=1924098 RepID=UPI003F9652B6